MNLKTLLSALTFCLYFSLIATETVAQSYEHVATVQSQKEMLSYMADDCARGRETGTMYNHAVASFIQNEFARYGVKPLLKNSYFQLFKTEKGKLGHNVIGFIPSRFPSDRYVIVSAHYDHIGAVNGFVYNGADDNASGVTVLLTLAKMFARMSVEHKGPDKNIIFIAFDGKEANMAGSKFFVSHLPVPKEEIVCDINIDQIGTVLQPVHKLDTNFVIVLGKESLPEKNRETLNDANRQLQRWLDINYSFHGSRAFSDYNYKTSDQYSFHQAGIPALLFTSGFHDHTYKTSDDIDIISFPVLRNRTLLLFHFIRIL